MLKRITRTKENILLPFLLPVAIMAIPLRDYLLPLAVSHGLVTVKYIFPPETGGGEEREGDTRECNSGVVCN